MNPRLLVAGATLPVVLLAIACISASPGRITGDWGGDEIGVHATPERVAMRLSCGTGSFRGGISPDSKGAFSLTGTITTPLSGATPILANGVIAGDTLAFVLTPKPTSEGIRYVALRNVPFDGGTTCA